MASSHFAKKQKEKEIELKGSKIKSSYCMSKFAALAKFPEEFTPNSTTLL